MFLYKYPKGFGFYVRQLPLCLHRNAQKAGFLCTTILCFMTASFAEHISRFSPGWGLDLLGGYRGEVDRSIEILKEGGYLGDITERIG